MKKLLLFTTMLGLAIAGCSEKDKNDLNVILDQGRKQQTAYADEDDTGSGFTFTASGTWIADVVEAESAKSNAISWLKLLVDGRESYQGDAGTYMAKIGLETNYTGSDRSATVIIHSGGDRIEITVTQNGRTVAGEIPSLPIPVKSVSIDKTDIELNKAETESLTATVLPADASVKTVVWKSSDEKVATVDDQGVVTAVSEGSAKIRATSSTDEKIFGECEITVTDHKYLYFGVNSEPKRIIECGIMPVGDYFGEGSNGMMLCFKLEGVGAVDIELDIRFDFLMFISPERNTLSRGLYKSSFSHSEYNLYKTVCVPVKGINQETANSFGVFEYIRGSIDVVSANTSTGEYEIVLDTDLEGKHDGNPIESFMKGTYTGVLPLMELEPQYKRTED